MRGSSVSLLCFLLILTGLSAPAAAKRVALVIGNDSYENVTDLQKAVNDAKAVGAALESIGFDVLRAENVSRRDMNSQLQSFASKLEEGDEAVFFFAGHGVEIEGRNFLLPVDMPEAKPGQEEFVEAEAVSAARVLETIKRRGARVAILVLDACRDNPFQREGTRSLGGSRGLARMDASKGTFILLSADFGQTALDRLSNSDPDPNSVFTRSLIPMLKRPGLSLPQMARQVRVEVEQLALGVSHDQRPAYYDGLTGDFFFAGEADEAKRDAPVAAPAPVAPPPADNAVEVAFWNSVQSSDSAEAIQEYLSRFPNGAFAGLAKLRLKALEQKQAALPPPAAEDAPERAEASSRSAAPVTECDRLAATGNSQEMVSPAVSEEEFDGQKAFAACQLALTDYPTESRFELLLGRALESTGDYAEAFRAHERAAALNSTDAMYVLAAIYLGAIPEYRIAQDVSKFRQLIERAAELGNPMAMYTAGLAHFNGEHGFNLNHIEAAGWILKSVDAGNEVAAEKLLELTWSTEFRREAQTLLKAKGVYQGPIDGKFGPGVKQAVVEISERSKR